jgi:hypothetical protein
VRRLFRAPASQSNAGTRPAGAFGSFTLALLGAAITALLFATSASAGYKPVGSISCAGTPAGSCEPTAIAVEEASGDVYIIDKAHEVIDRFHNNGTSWEYLSQIAESGEFEPGFYAEDNYIAVDNSGGAGGPGEGEQGRLYAISEGRETLFAFNPSGTLRWEESEGFNSVCGVGVDSSGNPWTGDYFLGVQQHSAETGAPIGEPVALDHFAFGTMSTCQLAFDSADNLYVTHWHHEIYQYKAADYTTSSLELGGNYFDVATNSATGNVFAVAESGQLSAWKSTGTTLGTFGSGLISVGVDGSRNRIYAGNSGELRIFEERPQLFINFGGSGSGSVQCDTGAGPEPCSSFYEEGETVTITNTSGPGSQFIEWTGQCDSISGNECEVTITGTDRIVEAVNNLESEPFAISQTGPGAGSVECEDNGGGLAPCAASYLYGHTIKVVAIAAVGSEISTVAGTGSASACSSSPCEFTINGPSEVTVQFDLESEPFAISQAGSGAGSVECEDNGGGLAPCAASYLYGHTIKVVASAAVGSEISTVAGTGSASACSSSPCEFTINGPSEVTVQFKPEGAKPLVVWVAGQGTVSSNPSGMSCLGEECGGEFAPGSVELEAHPASGYVLAGWIGCKHAGASTCTVNVSGSETEVTVVFVQQAPGVTVTPEPPGAHCPNGGVKVESSAGTEYICNGGSGSQGPTGPTGPSGGTGPTGPSGGTGAPGGTGATGAAGPQGSQGSKGDKGEAGPQGAQGPAGNVTCKVKQKGKKVKVTCTVKQGASSSRVHWRLTKAGHTVRAGASRADRIRLGALPVGHYRLHVRGSRGATAIVVG